LLAQQKKDAAGTLAHRALERVFSEGGSRRELGPHLGHRAADAGRSPPPSLFSVFLIRQASESAGVGSLWPTGLVGVGNSINRPKTLNPCEKNRAAQPGGPLDRARQSVQRAFVFTITSPAVLLQFVRVR
jgi:hypothetical protein